MHRGHSSMLPFGSLCLAPTDHISYCKIPLLQSKCFMVIRGLWTSDGLTGNNRIASGSPATHSELGTGHYRTSMSASACSHQLTITIRIMRFESRIQSSKVGHWKVHHRKLKQRLANNHEWIEFEGTLFSQPLMGRHSNAVSLCGPSTQKRISGQSGGSTAGHHSDRWIRL